MSKLARALKDFPSAADRAVAAAERSLSAARQSQVGLRRQRVTNLDMVAATSAAIEIPPELREPETKKLRVAREK